MWHYGNYGCDKYGGIGSTHTGHVALFMSSLMALARDMVDISLYYSMRIQMKQVCSLAATMALLQVNLLTGLLNWFHAL